MKIHEIKQQKKNNGRYNLYGEDGFIGALSQDTMIKYGIREEKEITLDALNEIMQHDHERYAFDKALHFLSFKARTKNDILRYLRDKGLNDEAIGHAVEKLESYGYINDQSYAGQYVKSLTQSKKEGRLAVEYKLKQKGIDKETIAGALAGFTAEDEAQNARDLYALLNQKYKNDEERKRKMKIIRNMAAKGYDYELIQSLVHERED